MMGGLMTALAPPKDAAAIKGGMDELGLVLGDLFQGVAYEAVQSHQEIPTRVGKPIYEWLPLDDKSKLPEHALLAGKDHENAVFVGRGVLDGSISASMVDYSWLIMGRRWRCGRILRFSAWPRM